VCALLKKSFRGKVTNVVRDTVGRRILLNIDDNGMIYTLVNIYCPSILKDRIAFLNDCSNWVQANRIPGSSLIVGGDVNCVAWSTDRSSLETDKSSLSLRHLKTTRNLTDAWKLMNPDTTDYTYIDPSFRDRNSRIDIICIDENMLDKIQHCEHSIAPCPDHKAVILSIRCSEKKRGRGYWKLNTSILAEEKYRNEIREIITNTIKDHNDIENLDKGLIWELIKIRVKEFSIQYCCHRSKRNEIETKILESKLIMIDNDLKVNCNDEALKLSRKFIKEQLDAIYVRKGIGAQIRSKVQWVEEGERSTSYFLAIENHRQGNNAIKALKDNGVTLSEDHEILNTAKNFYSELYTGKNPDNHDIDDGVNLQCLSAEKSDMCEGDVLKEKCENAINKIKRNKSPGEDGLPVEFYQTFWKEISEFLVDVYESYEMNSMPISMRKSIMTLIHKKDDRCNISNYRPISLTNVDYRILAFVLSMRLQNVISDVIQPEQVAYIKGRFIGSNVRLVHDVFFIFITIKI
jgi:hypothetical protein